MNQDYNLLTGFFYRPGINFIINSGDNTSSFSSLNNKDNFDLWIHSLAPRKDYFLDGNKLSLKPNSEKIQNIREVQTSNQLELKTISTNPIKNLDAFYADGGKIDNVILGNVRNSSILNLSSFSQNQTGIALELKGKYESKKIETKLKTIKIEKKEAFRGAKFKIAQIAIEDLDAEEVEKVAEKIEEIDDNQDEDPVPEIIFQKIVNPDIQTKITNKVTVIRSRLSSGSGSGSGTGTSIGTSLVDAFLSASDASSGGSAIGIELIDQILFDLFLSSALFGPETITT